MAWRRSACIPRLLAPASLCVSSLFVALEHHGWVTFGGLPLPEAAVIASQRAKKFTTTSDQRGTYRFDDLPDGDRPASANRLLPPGSSSAPPSSSCSSPPNTCNH
jgi:hypothetical protein